MATFERHVDVEWKGSVMEGGGTAKAGSGAFNLPVTFPSRIGEPGGKTSPEELMAAAHAACYAMALNGTIGRTEGVSVDRTTVRATAAALAIAGVAVTVFLLHEWLLAMIGGRGLLTRMNRLEHTLAGEIVSALILAWVAWPVARAGGSSVYAATACAAAFGCGFM